VWTQQLYGRTQRLLGAGHGFVGNVRALAGRPDLLGAERFAELERRTARVHAAEALRDGGLANWSPVFGEPQPERIRVQWCHGAPGVICSTAGIVPGDDAFTELLVAGGELVWRAGPLRKGPGLCHGSAGNGFAFLKLLRRTGDERWLERARAFAMHAIGQLEGGRFSLWTGDVGAALFLRACVDRDDRFPTIDVW
jgi:lantibiotic modifying enzyme